MILLNVVSKLIEVCVIGSVVAFVILFVSAWIRGEFKKRLVYGMSIEQMNLKKVQMFQTQKNLRKIFHFNEAIN